MHDEFVHFGNIVAEELFISTVEALIYLAIPYSSAM
jgi:hypothetical protein